MHKYKQNKKGKLKKFEQTIILLYLSGFTQSWIAKEFNCGHGSIIALLKRHGVKTRNLFKGKPKEETLRIRNENRYILGPKGKKRCLNCHKIFPLQFFPIKKKNVKNSNCQYCDKEKRAEYKDKMRRNPERYCQYLVKHLKNRAKYTKVPFGLEPLDLINQLHRQQNRCYYTKEPLNFGLQVRTHNYPHYRMPSIDRLTPIRGYVKSNVVWVLYYVNRMKSDLPHKEFLKTCKLICKNHNIL